MIYTNDMISQFNKKKKNTKKIYRYITFPILIICIIFTIDVFFQKFILRKSNVSILGYSPLIVMTGSMEPEIKKGDIIFVKSISQENLKNGDIITYYIPEGEKTITHRIIDISEKNGKIFYKTQGDNNNTPDSNLVSYDQIIGTIKFKINGIGKLLVYIFTGTGLCAVIIIVLIAYSISNEKRIKIIAREEARRMFNTPKYQKKED